MVIALSAFVPCFAMSLLMIASPASSWTPQPSRRVVIESAVVALCCFGLPLVENKPALAVVDSLPEFIRPYTNLAPVGLRNLKKSEKTEHLTLQELAKRLENDLVIGAQGQGGYFLTGDLSTDIFRDDCVFLDPTNEVSSLRRYQEALRILFDPKSSIVQLLEPLQIDQEARTISGRIRSRGFLQLPWNPYITAYESSIVYTIDDNGLIARQDQRWSKTADEALRETFTPTIFEPPPKCELPQPDDEPAVVTHLFRQINGRRPNEYSRSERIEIAALIDEICRSSWDWKSGDLQGKWMLVYLQPGPSGAGVDRRIPFPEFDFNDSYQVFTENTVTNIGQVLGPILKVDVFGTLKEQDIKELRTPKSYMASITSGKLCAQQTCLPLPITGQGLFDGMYLGRRLRIGQNLNGGGARVVQVRVK